MPYRPQSMNNVIAKFVGLLPLLLCVTTLASPALAQQPRPQDRTVPRDEYFVALRGYYTGEYRQALSAFKNVANGGIRSTEGRWIDSICYHTMAGECYYHMGATGPRARTIRSGPRSGGAASGMDAARAISRNDRPRRFAGSFDVGCFQPPHGAGQLPRNDVELSRPSRQQRRDSSRRRGDAAAALSAAGERNRSLHGLVDLSPVGIARPGRRSLAHFQKHCRHRSRRGKRRRITGRKFGSKRELGFAQAAAGKRAEAVTHLSRAVVVGDAYDHPLSPLVLLALGKLHLEDGSPGASGEFLSGSDVLGR